MNLSYPTINFIVTISVDSIAVKQNKTKLPFLTNVSNIPMFKGNAGLHSQVGIDYINYTYQ